MFPSGRGWIVLALAAAAVGCGGGENENDPDVTLGERERPARNAVAPTEPETPDADMDRRLEEALRRIIADDPALAELELEVQGGRLIVLSTVDEETLVRVRRAADAVAGPGALQVTVQPAG